MTLDEWMYNEKIPGISGIDTRELTKKLRTGGFMMVSLVVSDSEINVEQVKKPIESATHYDSEQFMDDVSNKEEKVYGKDENTVVVIDTGAKHAILRNVRDIGYKVVLLPWNTPYEKIMSYNPKGIILSSGHKDPQKGPDTIDTANKLIEDNIPTLGICLTAQILGIAGNTETYKLKYRNRGQNKPCVNLENNQVYVTSQNNGYGIKPESLEKSDFNLWFTNADDKTVEGIKHKTKNCIAVQFHPEAAPGPYDCKFVFEELKQLMEKK